MSLSRKSLWIGVAVVAIAAIVVLIAVYSGGGGGAAAAGTSARARRFIGPACGQLTLDAAR